MMDYRKPLKMFASLLLIALLLSACAGASPAAPAAGSTSEPTEITVQLSWVYDYSGASLFAAEKNGHYAKENLKVTLEQGGFGSGGYIEPIDEVLSGKAE